MKIVLHENGIIIDGMQKDFSDFTGFVCEYNIETKKIHNIIFFLKTGAMVYTIDDTEENIIAFTEALSKKVPFQKDYKPNFLVKILRKLKI